MNPIAIRRAVRDDAAAIADMLKQLAEHLGDGAAFASVTETILKHGFGERLLFHCMMAENGSDPCGIALYFPHFSTLRGKPGVFVQDLWVDAAVRGARVGRRLLAAAAAHARDEWGAEYLSLMVYRDNESAAAFYRELGFSAWPDDIAMTLADEAFGNLAALPEKQS